MAWAEPLLREIGRAAVEELLAWADACERQPAALRSFDAWGERVDEVIYPQAWRQLAAQAARSGLVAWPYERETLTRCGAETRLVQAALCYLFAPSTATYLCPVAMTDGAARVLTVAGGVGQPREVIRHLISRNPGEAWTSGQWMTERQGGSDVGRNAVVAKRDGDRWRLFGQKFFCSNIGCEVALALARPEGAPPGTRGLALFLVPRDVADGRRNAYRIDRLTDKLGTRAMATGAVMLASAYAGQREAFGRKLEAHPLHREVLGQMAAEADGALYLTMRMAQLLGRIEMSSADAAELALFRVGIALAKLYTAKQAVAVASEAIECFGGQGYMEDTGLPRLLRDAQVLPIWEGTTSVLALDVFRVLGKGNALDAMGAELERLHAPARDDALDLARKARLEGGDTGESMARRLAFSLARSWIGGLLGAAGVEVRPRDIGLPLR